MLFIHMGKNSKGKKATYAWYYCYINHHKADTHLIRLTEGGNLVKYSVSVTIPTTELTAKNIYWNSIIYTLIIQYMCTNVKDFYLVTDTAHYEWFGITAIMIPEECMIE